MSAYVPSDSALLVPLDARRPSAYRVPGVRIIAGEYPGHYRPAATRAKLRALLEAGVTFFLDLTEPGERPAYEEVLRQEAVALGVRVQHVRCPVHDLDVPACAQSMLEILDTIDRALANGDTIYLHCWAGVGRTGTVVGCFLARSGLSGEAALAHLATLWCTVAQSQRYPRSPETHEQHEFIRRWAAGHPRPV